MRVRHFLNNFLPCSALVSLALASCAQTPESVPLRSLERSGKLSLLCLDLGAPDRVGYSLEDCQSRKLITRPDGSLSEVHLYALVNQTTRGEVVLLDIPGTAVIDTNPSSPGYNFLQVGAQPVDIVTTPESTATFVATAEANHPGIYALPSTQLLDHPTLLSWPACSLPARPGAMTLLVAPTEGFCPGPNYAVDTLQEQGDPAHPHGDLSQEQKQPGARKLLVALPTEGELLLIDAQSLLDRPTGSFDPCPIERRFKLDTTPESIELPDTPSGSECPPRPATSEASVCPVRKPKTVEFPAIDRSFPVAFTRSENTLYIADQKAPRIHTLDISDPCSPIALPPLLPSSFDQPWRPVTTRALAVSPITSDSKRYLYAIDDLDGSAMIFDISPNGGSRSPMIRDRPEYFPFSPRDRLNLGAPIQDLLFLQQDHYSYDSDGTKISGIQCDPVDTTAPGAIYTPNAGLTDGASPIRLRGTFALAALTTGQLTIIDVDDLDATCRRPRSTEVSSTTEGNSAQASETLPDWITGCNDECIRDNTGACIGCQASLPSAPGASGEGTCRVVVRHEVRSRNYLTDSDNLGRNLPTIAFPTLTLNGAALRTDKDDASEEARQNPKLLGPNNTVLPPQSIATVDPPDTTPCGPGRACPWILSDGTWIDPSPQNTDRNFILPDTHEPRAAISQDWAVSYEGVLPGTAGKVGRLLFREKDPQKRGLYDTNGSFCYLGVQDQKLARLDGYRLYDREQIQQLDDFARTHNDWVEITNNLLSEEDPYWNSVGDECSYLRCRATFGTAEAPTANRSFRIREAYQDRLLIDPLDPNAPEDAPITVPDPTRNGAPLNPDCCFPTLTSYQIRGGSTWIATGSVSGFLHRTTLGPDGHCALLGVDSSSGELCEASFLDRTGRIYEIPTSSGSRDPNVREHNDPYTFHNPYFFALVYEGAQPSRRGMTFSWSMTGGFQALEVNLGRGSSQIAPQSMVYHPALGTEVLITDAALQGVMSVDLFSLAVVRNFLLALLIPRNLLRFGAHQATLPPMAGTGNGNKNTPSMKQYFKAKEAHPDAILFFRIGDFYEMFHEDAVIVARELDLTLTSRNKNAAEEVPMAGVPYHAAHQYIGKLLTKSYKVAICEQMEDPTKVRGLVRREVVRVFTPALVTDSEQLDAKQNAFLAAIEPDEDAFGLALFDFSTGELRATRLSSGSELLGELARSAPRELLLGPVDDETRQAIQALLTTVALREDGGWTPTQGRSLITQHLAGTPLERSILSLDPAAFLAATRVVRFAAGCSPGTPLPIRSLETWDIRETLLLDEVAQKHLELVSTPDGSKAGSLLHLLDSTCTSGGARLLRRQLLAPLLDPVKINERLDIVQLFLEQPDARSSLREALSQISDLGRLAVRASLKEATPKDLASLRESLKVIPTVSGILASLPEPASRILKLTSEPIDALPDLQQHLTLALVDRPPALAREAGIFRTGFNAELDEQRDLQNGGAQKLSAMEAQLREETGVTNLKVKYTRVFGWYIEVTGRHLNKVPPSWRRKQTVANAERFTNEELDLLSRQAITAEECANELERKLYEELLQHVAASAPRVHRLATRIAEWDIYAALADTAHRNDYTRPTVDTSLTLELKDARHPVVEKTAAAGQFVPNDIQMDVDGERFWLITGPNMSGKSTLMRQVALIVLMAQMGSFVPAASARIGVVDRILSRVGASDNVSRGESTFMVEMRETSAILSAASRRSLVILDEIGRGTSTYDGLSIAWAVAEHLHDVIQCRALFATHYHEITELTKLAQNAVNYSVSAKEFGDDIVFLHKITRGAASRSYGIAVAKLAGLPESVLARSRVILENLESSGILPAGTHGSLRRRDKQGRAQLDNQLGLFDSPAEPPTKHPAIETLRTVEPERLSPLDALQLIIKLKGLVK